MADTQPVEESVLEERREEPCLDESMTVKEVSIFLHRNGIPHRFCEVFEENYIDGAVFLTLTEADVKAMIPPLGLVKKIMKLVPNKEKENSPSISQSEAPVTPPHVTTPTSGSTVSVISSSGTSTPVFNPVEYGVCSCNHYVRPKEYEEKYIKSHGRLG